MASIAQNAEDLRLRLEAACPNGGSPVSIIAVTKYATLDQMRAVIACGFTCLGESRIQDLEEKKRIFPDPNLEWHFIGRLQSNKVKKAVMLCDVIQSVDRLSLLDEINQAAEKLNKKIKIFLQVRFHHSETQGGFEPENLNHHLDKVVSFQFVEVVGIMTIGPHTSSADSIRNCFQQANQLFNDLRDDNRSIRYLCMGMSGDFEIAVAEGANMIRIGSLLLQEE